MVISQLFSIKSDKRHGSHLIMHNLDVRKLELVLVKKLRAI